MDYARNVLAAAIKHRPRIRREPINVPVMDLDAVLLVSGPPDRLFDLRQGDDLEAR